MEENKKPNNPNAFPTMEHGFDRMGCPSVSTFEGMTLRDYFAAKAMQAIISAKLVNGGKDFEIGTSGKSNSLVVNASYEIADEMLKQRENEKQP